MGREISTVTGVIAADAACGSGVGRLISDPVAATLAGTCAAAAITEACGVVGAAGSPGVVTLAIAAEVVGARVSGAGDATDAATTDAGEGLASGLADEDTFSAGAVGAGVIAAGEAEGDEGPTEERALAAGTLCMPAGAMAGATLDSAGAGGFTARAAVSSDIAGVVTSATAGGARCPSASELSDGAAWGATAGELSFPDVAAACGRELMG